MRDTKPGRILAEIIGQLELRKAYGWICDHGTSVGRPALALLGLWFVTFLAWRGWAADEAAITTWDVLYHTARMCACQRLPMSKSKPLTPYAPHRRRCIFSAPSPRSSARSFCFSWPWRSGSNFACLFDAIQRRFDPWGFPPSPRRI